MMEGWDGEKRAAAGAMFTIVAVQGILAFDYAAISVVLPAIGTALHMSPAQVPWIISAMILTTGSLLIFAGRLVDVLTPRSCTLVGLALFVAGAAMTVATDHVGLVLKGRVVAGLAVALMQPALLAMATTMFEGRRRQLALSLFVMSQSIGAGIGVLLGGYLAARAGWHWIVILEGSAALAAWTIALLLLPRGVRRPVAMRDLDPLGLVASTATLALFLLGIAQIGDPAAGAGRAIGIFLAAAVGGALFVAIERRAHAPLVPLPLLRHRAFMGPLLAVSLTTACVGGIFYLIGLYLQKVAHLSPAISGYIFLPHVAMAAMVTWLAPRLLPGRSHRANILLGLLVLMLAYGLLLFLPVAPVAIAVAAALIVPLGVMFAYVAGTDAAIASLDAESRGAGSALLLAAQTMAIAIAMTIYGVAITPLSPGGPEHVAGGIYAAIFIALLGIPLTLKTIRN